MLSGGIHHSRLKTEVSQIHWKALRPRRAVYYFAICSISFYRTNIKSNNVVHVRYICDISTFEFFLSFSWNNSTQSQSQLETHRLCYCCNGRSLWILNEHHCYISSVKFGLIYFTLMLIWNLLQLFLSLLYSASSTSRTFVPISVYVQTLYHALHYGYNIHS